MVRHFSFQWPTQSCRFIHCSYAYVLTCRQSSWNAGTVYHISSHKHKTLPDLLWTFSTSGCETSGHLHSNTPSQRRDDADRKNSNYVTSTSSINLELVTFKKSYIFHTVNSHPESPNTNQSWHCSFTWVWKVQKSLVRNGDFDPSSSTLRSVRVLSMSLSCKTASFFRTFMAYNTCSFFLGFIFSTKRTCN